MGKGIKIVAIHPMDRTYVVDLGTQYTDTGPAAFLKQKIKSFLIQQGFKDASDVVFTIDFRISGNNFEYQGGIPVAGKVQRIAVDVDGDRAYEISGLGLSVPALAKLYKDDDPFKAFNSLLKGDDKVIGSQLDDPDIYGGKGNDILWGRGGADFLNGGKGDDVNDGGLGNDFLADTKGSDTFQFSTNFNLADNLNFNFDTIKRFGAGDEIYLSYKYFGQYDGSVTLGNSVSKGEFRVGTSAVDGNDFLLWDEVARILYYDPDANGPIDPVPIFETLNDANINHKVFAVGLDGY